MSRALVAAAAGTRESPYSRFLPYGESVPAEALAQFDHFERLISDVIVAQDPFPALGGLCHRFEQCIKVYGFCFDLKRHVKIVELLFGLLQLPDVDYWTQQTLASLLYRLIRKRRVFPDDALTLDWRTCYDIVRKAEFHKLRERRDAPAAYITTLVKLMCASRRFFSETSTTEILAELRPGMCPHDELVYRSAMFLALLLPTRPNTRAARDPQFLTWLPEILTYWQWYDNMYAWDHIWFLCIARAVKYNVGSPLLAPVFSQLDWIFCKILRQMAVPVGSSKSAYQRNHKLPENCSLLLKTQRAAITAMASFVVYTFNHAETVNQLSRLIVALESFFHPSNSGSWSNRLGSLLYNITDQYVRRKHEECETPSIIPAEHFLPPAFGSRLVGILKPVIFLGLFSKSPQLVSSSAWALRQLAFVAPEEILPAALEKIYPALETLTETHQTTSALSALLAISRPLFTPSNFPGGSAHIFPLLNLTLPGIDPNDLFKTQCTLQFYYFLFFTIPVVDCSGMASRGESEEEQSLLSATAMFESWICQFLDQIFFLLETQLDIVGQRRTHEQNSSNLASASCHALFQQLSDDLFDIALSKVFHWTTTHLALPCAKAASLICCSLVRRDDKKTLNKFVPFFHAKIVSLASWQKRFDDAEADEHQKDDELLWYLNLVARLVRQVGPAVLDHKEAFLEILRLTLFCASREIAEVACKMLRHLLRSLSSVTLCEASVVSPRQRAAIQNDPVELFRLRGNSPGLTDDLDPQWNIPGPEQLAFAEELVEEFFDPAVAFISEPAAWAEHAGTTATRLALRVHLGIITSVARVGSNLLPEVDAPDMECQYLKISTNMLPVKTSVNEQHTAAARGRREKLLRGLCTLTDGLLQHGEDDVKNLEAIIAIAYQLLCVRVVSQNNYMVLQKSYNSIKQASANLIEGNKCHSRVLLLERLRLQQSMRLVVSRYSTPHHELYQELMRTLVRLSTSLYSPVRASAQRTLSVALNLFSKASRQLFPMVLEALTPIPADETHSALKGALYLMCVSGFASLVAGEPDCLVEFVKKLLLVQNIDRPSVQEIVTHVFKMLSKEFRPMWLNRVVPRECFDLLLSLRSDMADREPDFAKALAECPASTTALQDSYRQLLDTLLANLVASGTEHWRYELMLAGLLHGLLRDDLGVAVPIVQYFVQNLLNDTLALRNLSFRTCNLILLIHKRTVLKEKLDLGSTEEHPHVYGPRPANTFYLHHPQAAIGPEEYDAANFVDKNFVGWNCLSNKVVSYRPLAEQPPFVPDEQSNVFLHALQDGVFLERLFSFIAMERNDGTSGVFNDTRAELYKGIFRNLGPAAIAPIRPHLEALSQAHEKATSQRAAAEIVGGMVRGMKHWPAAAVKETWEWLMPLLRTTWNNVHNDGVGVWCSSIRFCVYDRDPRRVQPLFDELLQPPLEKSDETPFAQQRRMSFLLTALAELSWRGPEASRTLLYDLTQHLGHPYKLVREKIALALCTTFRNLWLPPGLDESPGTLHMDDFVQTLCETLSSSLEAAAQAEPGDAAAASAAADSSDAAPGATADENEVDHSVLAVKRAKTVLSWIRQTVSEEHSVSLMHYMPRLLPVTFVLSELGEDPDLHALARVSLSLASQVVMLPYICDSVFNAVINTAQSPSWHVRQRVLNFIQVSLFRNMFMAPRDEIVNLLISMLSDERYEIQELASVTLSGTIRCGFAKAELRTKFAELAKMRIRKRKRGVAKSAQPFSEVEKEALRQRHIGVLGLKAFLLAFPYSMPEWMPQTLVALCDHVNDPEPIKTSAKKALSEFWRTHRDAWQQNKHLFTEDELFTITELLISPSYYA